MKVAPIGAFGAMAFTIGKYGVDSLLPLAKLMGTFYATCLIFVFVVLGTIARAHGFSIWKFIKYIKEELLICLGTSSSGVGPAAHDGQARESRCEKIDRRPGRSNRIFLQPGRHSDLSDDGCGLHRSGDEHTDGPHPAVTLLGVFFSPPRARPAITGSGFIVLAATLSAVGHVPVAGLALILGIDRFMSEARALTNLIGNGVATLVVGKWCKELDVKQMRRHLDQETELEANAPEAVLDLKEEHMPVFQARSHSSR